MKKYIVPIILLAFAACGPLKKASNTPSISLPNPSQADSITRTLIKSEAPLVTFPIEDLTGLHIYSFLPCLDTTNLRIIEIGIKDGAWGLENDVEYPCFDDPGLRFTSFVDSLCVKNFGGETHLVFSTLHENADKTEAQKTIVLYSTSTYSLRSLSFRGKYLSDGRIEGSSNRKIVAGAETPQMRWAIAAQASDKSLLELSEADILSDQSIQWWLKNNPNVFGPANKVSFGQLPKKSSLVQAYHSEKKESKASYRAAMFDFRGYTVVVGYRRQNDSYFLAWAEPMCKDKNKDRLLNNIYFENDSSLVLFYYHGRRTYKYRLSLASGRLTK